VRLTIYKKPTTLRLSHCNVKILNHITIYSAELKTGIMSNAK